MIGTVIRRRRMTQHITFEFCSDQRTHHFGFVSGSNSEFCCLGFIHWSNSVSIVRLARARLKPFTLSVRQECPSPLEGEESPEGRGRAKREKRIETTTEESLTCEQTPPQSLADDPQSKAYWHHGTSQPMGCTTHIFG